MTHSANQGQVTLYRLRIISYFVPIFALVILARLFYWQIIRGPSLSAAADRQHQEISTLTTQRGDIYDSDKNLLVGTKTLYHLFIYKPQVDQELTKIVSALTPILAPEPPEASPGAKPVTKADMEAATSKLLTDRLNLSSNWISLKHFLEDDQKKQIESLNIKGLGFEEEFVRFYPEASLAGQVLGFVGQDLAGQPQGYFGLEGFFDRQLRGREGKVLTEKDALGNPILIGRFDVLKNISGRSVVTTINKKIQFIVESLLKEGINKYQAKAGNVIVMDSTTGRVLAMASFPNYDPGHFSDFDKNSYKNPNVADLFEPGSIFKVLVMAAGINEKVITPDTICDICNGPVNIGQYTIKTWDDKYHPDSTMTDVLVHSDNTGMVFVGRKLGSAKFADYLARFGFGKLSGIELQDETTSPPKTEKDLKEIDLATNSFGQGIAVTPIQIIAAVNAIANQGIFLRPSIVDEIIAADKEVKTDKQTGVRILDQQTASLVTQMMVAAVDRGEAKWAKPAGLSIAGKTGTAQVPIQGHYDPEKTIASFVGFFPSANPKYTMLVSLREPGTSIWGSETAAPLWFGIAKQLLLQ